MRYSPPRRRRERLVEPKVLLLFPLFLINIVFLVSVDWLPPLRESHEATKTSSLPPRPHLQFVHIPKTAGSTIDNQSIKNGWNLGHGPLHPWKFKGRDSFTWSPRDVDHNPNQMSTAGQCSFYHVPPAWFDPPLGPYKDKELFTVVRDPYQRIISEFRWICWAGRGVGVAVFDALKMIIDLSGEDIFVPPLSDRNDNENIEKCRTDRSIMNEFLRNAIRTQRGVEDEHSVVGNRKSNRMVTDCHFVPQHIYTQSVHHVFCSLPPLKKFLASRGYELDKLRDENLNEYDARAMLDDDVIELINELYREDFALCDEFEMIMN